VAEFKPDWHAFAIIEELAKENMDLCGQVDPHFVDNSFFWGPDYFVDEYYSEKEEETDESGPNKQVVNFFVNQVLQDSRYALAFIKNISIFMT